MDPLNTAFQPFWDLINSFHAIFILVFFGMGVCSAFFLKNLILSLIAASFIFLIASYLSLSNLMPGIGLRILPYLGALVIGWAVGSLFKWIARKMAIR